MINLYSTLTLDRTIWVAGFLHLKTRISMKNTVLWIQGTPSICPFPIRIFIDFLRKIYEWKMKNPLKSRHQFCWVHRVYGIQNDRLDLRSNKFLTVLKSKHCSWKYLQIFDLFFYLFCKYRRLQCFDFKTVKNSLFLRLSRSFWIP